MKNLLILTAVLLTITPLAAHAADEENNEYYAVEVPSDNVNDPLEPVNRVVFRFNGVADTYILRPVAVGYRYVVPQWGRQRVTNVFYNLSEPVTLVNSVLQADPQNAFTSTWRFIINSTVGVVGIFDPASDLGLKEHQEDFGQTLGRWGYRNPPYIVLPLLGPSTARDGLGLVVDYYTNPFYDGLLIDNDATKIGLAVVNGVDKRTNILPLTDDIEKTSLDPYVTYRSYYLQNRENKINNGQNDNNTMTNY